MHVTAIGANHYSIYDEKGNNFLQSYRSIVAKVSNGKIFLDTTYWNYSRTTSKYRNIFLRETTEVTKKKIASGEYVLCDLN
jgi:hypothetical protein